VGNAFKRVAMVVLAMVAVAVGVVVWQALTGPESGQVPNLVGRSTCDAEKALADADLRWRYADDKTVHSRPYTEPPGVSTRPSCVPVERQHPAPGTKLRSEAVVRLKTACTPKTPCL
jgi:hypothetical protein